jgi:S1-C subfamily serine protease
VRFDFQIRQSPPGDVIPAESFSANFPVPKITLDFQRLPLHISPMNKRLCTCLLFAAAAFSRAQSSSGTITKISDPVYRRAAQAVVRINAGEGWRFGAGLIIGKTRNGAPIILTSNALISGFETQLRVQLENQTAAVPAQIITPEWRNRDLVLLAARSGLAGAPALDYGRADQILAGEEASVLGFPATSFLSQNSGEVVRTAPEQLTLSFALKPGQEGGPVIDKNGRVIGIALARGGERGVAVSIDLARLVVEEWLRNAPLAETWREGKSAKKWYGWVLGVLLITAAGVGIGVSGVL